MAWLALTAGLTAGKTLKPCWKIPLSHLVHFTLALNNKKCSKTFSLVGTQYPDTLRALTLQAQGGRGPSLMLHAAPRSRGAGWKGQQASPVYRRSAGEGCGGSLRGDCPGAVGSSSCSAWALECYRVPARLSCGANTDSTFGKGENPRRLLQQQGTGSGTAAPRPAPPVVLGTKKLQHTSQTHGVSVSSGERKAFLASLKSLGAAFQALPRNCAGWISLLLLVLLGVPENSPMGALARQDCAYEADERLSPDVTPSLRSRQRLRPRGLAQRWPGHRRLLSCKPQGYGQGTAPGGEPTARGAKDPQGARRPSSSKSNRPEVSSAESHDAWGPRRPAPGVFERR